SEVSGTVASLDSGHAEFGLKHGDGTVQQVTTSASTEFEGGLHTFADLAVGQHVHVKGAAQGDGSLAASSVEAENEDEDQDDDADEFKGTITSLDAAHSSFDLQLADKSTKHIVTNAQTQFDDGLTDFGSLKVGAIVEVHGATQTGGSILATRVQ